MSINIYTGDDIINLLETWSTEDLLTFLAKPTLQQYSDYDKYLWNRKTPLHFIKTMMTDIILIRTEKLAKNIPIQANVIEKEEFISEQIKEPEKKCLFRFNNGIYDARHKDKNGILSFEFYPNDNIPMNIFIADCQKSFDTDFTGSIECPVFTGILENQFDIFKDGDMIFDIFNVLLGRLLFNIEDNWQVTPHLHGFGQGKSTILSLISYLFEDNTIGYLRDEMNINVLQNLKNKNLVIGQEMGEVMSMTTFKRMSKAGPDCQLNFPNKGLPSLNTQQWNTPMITVGDRMKRNRNRIQIPFHRVIDDLDSTLLDQMKQNIGNILHHINSFYLYYYNINKDSLFDYIPESIY